jgi:hypothetical protein
VHAGTVAEEAQELETESLAGLFLAGANVEGRREGRNGKEMGVEGPEGEDIELLGGAGEVLAVEVGDLVDEGLGGLIGFHRELRL